MLTTYLNYFASNATLTLENNQHLIPATYTVGFNLALSFPIICFAYVRMNLYKRNHPKPPKCNFRASTLCTIQEDSSKIHFADKLKTNQDTNKEGKSFIGTITKANVTFLFRISYESSFN